MDCIKALRLQQATQALSLCERGSQARINPAHLLLRAAVRGGLNGLSVLLLSFYSHRNPKHINCINELPGLVKTGQ